MSEHYAIINDLSNSPRETAVLEVCSTIRGSAEFIVRPLDGPPSDPIAVPMTDKYFASSASSDVPNLFELTNGKSAIVEVRFAAGFSNVILRQRAGGTQIVLTVPRKEQSIGTDFIIPMGDPGQSAYVLVGNPSGLEVKVDLRIGLPTSPPDTTTFIGAWQVKAIPLAIPDCLAAIKSTSPVFMQLAIDTGKMDETVVLPG